MELNSIIIIYVIVFSVIGTSLSELHIDRDNSLCAQYNGVSIYLSIYPLCLLHPDPCKPWNALYINVVQVHDCQNSSYSLFAVKIVDEDGCIEPTETMEL